MVEEYGRKYSVWSDLNWRVGAGPFLVISSTDLRETRHTLTHSSGESVPDPDLFSRSTRLPRLMSCDGRVMADWLHQLVLSNTLLKAAATECRAVTRIISASFFKNGSWVPNIRWKEDDRRTNRKKPTNVFSELKSAVKSEQVHEMYKCTLIYVFSSNVCVH